MDRNETIYTIRAALKRRSGKAWSVTGGRGTGWGWIDIDAPPARRTTHTRLKAGATADRPEDYEHFDSGEPGGFMTDADRNQLAELLGLDSVHHQGVKVPSSHDYYQEYVDRAEGRQPTVQGKPYWD